MKKSSKAINSKRERAWYPRLVSSPFSASVAEEVAESKAGLLQSNRLLQSPKLLVFDQQAVAVVLVAALVYLYYHS